MTSRLASLACLGVGAVALAAAPVASARVLVHAPTPVLRCGKSIRTGVWYQSFTGGSRRATITIRTSAGRVVFHKRLRATAQRWQYFFYRGRCGRRYVVTYTTAEGRLRFPVRMLRAG